MDIDIEYKKHIIDAIRIQLRRYSKSNDWAVDIYYSTSNQRVIIAVIPVTNNVYEYGLDNLRKLSDLKFGDIRSWIREVLIAEGFDCNQMDKIRKLERTGYYHIRSGWTHLVTE